MSEWVTCAEVADAAVRMACSRGRGHDIGILIGAALLLLALLIWGLWRLQRIGMRAYRASQDGR